MSQTLYQFRILDRHTNQQRNQIGITQEGRGEKTTEQEVNKMK